MCNCGDYDESITVCACDRGEGEKAKRYQIFGDYGLDSEQMLESFDHLPTANEWARAYTRGGDLGGYSAIEVIWFADDGEAITEWRLCHDDE